MKRLLTVLTILLFFANVCFAATITTVNTSAVTVTPPLEKALDRADTNFTNINTQLGTVATDLDTAEATLAKFSNTQELGEGTSQTLTVYGHTELTSDNDTTGETGTLGSGEWAGQVKSIILDTDGGDDWSVTITNHETSDPEVALFDAANEYLLLMWSGTEWVTLANTCTFP